MVSKQNGNQKKGMWLKVSQAEVWENQKHNLAKGLFLPNKDSFYIKTRLFETIHSSK